jgi:hypothetical protein
MTGRLITLGEAMRAADAAENHGADVQVGAAPNKSREDRVRRKLALLRSIGSDGTFTLRAAIYHQPAANAAD